MSDRLTFYRNQIIENNNANRLAEQQDCEQQSAKGPTYVGNYQIFKTLGKGNFATVKLGRHRITNHEVAIKLVRTADMKEENLSKIRREIEIMKKLAKSEYLVCLYQVMQTNRYLILVNEYCSGGEVFDYISSVGKLTEQSSKHYFIQIVNAVEHLHNNHIVHRDLKTENLLLTSDCKRIKIADFGFANYFTPDSMLSTWCGSPPYAAPELFRGIKYLGPPVDIWSMGVILYVFVCGSLPFDAPNLGFLKARVLSGKFRIPFYMSTECESLIRNMLKLDPIKRYSIRQIKSHRWMKGGTTDNDQVNGGNKDDTTDNKISTLFDDDIVDYMINQLKISDTRKNIELSIQEEKFDDNYAIYRLLKDQPHFLVNHTRSNEAPQLPVISADQQAKRSSITTGIVISPSRMATPMNQQPNSYRKLSAPSSSTCDDSLKNSPGASQLDQGILSQVTVKKDQHGRNHSFTSNYSFYPKHDDNNVTNRDQLLSNLGTMKPPPQLFLTPPTEQQQQSSDTNQASSSKSTSNSPSSISSSGNGNVASDGNGGSGGGGGGGGGSSRLNRLSQVIPGLSQCAWDSTILDSISKQSPPCINAATIRLMGLNLQNQLPTAQNFMSLGVNNPQSPESLLQGNQNLYQAYVAQQMQPSNLIQMAPNQIPDCDLLQPVDISCSNSSFERRASDGEASYNTSTSGAPPTKQMTNPATSIACDQYSSSTITISQTKPMNPMAAHQSLFLGFNQQQVRRFPEGTSGEAKEPMDLTTSILHEPSATAATPTSSLPLTPPPSSSSAPNKQHPQHWMRRKRHSFNAESHIKLYSRQRSYPLKSHVGQLRNFQTNYFGQLNRRDYIGSGPNVAAHSSLDVPETDIRRRASDGSDGRTGCGIIGDDRHPYRYYDSSSNPTHTENQK